MGDYTNTDGTPLPRTVPQDPEAVRREQEVREATAEALRASRVGRGPTPDELAALREVEAEMPDIPQPRGGFITGCFGEHDRPSYDPRVEGLERRIAELERKLAEQPPPLDFGRVQTMTLRPGDTLVLHCDQRISRAVFDKLRKQFREQFPGHKVVILEKGLRLTVAHEAPEEPLADGWPR